MTTPPAYGSSRPSGAVIRGKAFGNTANIADMEVEHSAPTVLTRSAKYGYIYLYRSDGHLFQPLDDMEETSVFFKIAGPPEHLSIVLKELERKHPYTKGISQFIIISYNLTCILEECIHLWDGDLEKWELIGPFDVALDHSIPIEFELDWKNNLVLNILTVSLNFNCKC